MQILLSAVPKDLEYSHGKKALMDKMIAAINHSLEKHCGERDAFYQCGDTVRDTVVTFTCVRRKYIGVLFECCDVYARVYINRRKTAYVGWCPKCATRVEIKINPRGTASRFFKFKHA